MKYLDTTGLSHFWDIIKNRLLPSSKGENGTVLKSTDSGYEWGKVVDDASVSGNTAYSSSKTDNLLSTKAEKTTVESLSATVSTKADSSTVELLTQTVNTKTSINDSATETTTTWSGSKINTELGTKATQSSVDSLSGTVGTLSTAMSGKADSSTVTELSNTVSALSSTVQNKADQSTVDSLTTTVNTKANQDSVDSLSTTVSSLQTTVNSKANQSELDTLETTVSNIRQVPTGGTAGQFLRQDNTWANVPTGSWDQLITNVALSVSNWSKDYAVTPTQFPYGNRYDIEGLTPQDMVIVYVDNASGGMYTMSLCANVRVDDGFIVIGSNNNTISLTLKWIMIYKNKLPGNDEIYKAGFLVLGSNYDLARTLGSVNYIVTLPVAGWTDNKITINTDENGAGIFLSAGTNYMPFSTENYDFEISVPTLSSGTVENRTVLCKTGVYINNVTQKNLNQINVEFGCVNVPTAECKVLLSVSVNYQRLGSAF